MSLRLKFGVLLGLLGLAVLLTLGASWWTFSTLQSEVREPFRSMSVVLVALGEAKQAVETQRKIIRRASNPTDAPPIDEPSDLTSDQILQTFDHAHATAEQSLRRIDVSDWKIRSGTSSLSNLNERLAVVAKLGREYLQLRFAPSGSAATNSEKLASAALPARERLDALHDLIERMESRIVAETTEALKLDAELRSRLLLVLAIAFVIVALTCLQGVILIRRWVLRPVAELRTATARIAAGDFAYRIPLASSSAVNIDELLQLSAEVNHMAGMVKAMQDDRVERERLAALGEMVRRLAHNLRNPLAGIRGLAEITRTELKHLGANAGDMTENQDRIITAVDRFEKWLNELLSATRPLSIHPEPSEVPRWLNGLVDAHRPMAQTRGVRLGLDLAGCPPQATFDPRHLEYALSAMLSNAIEATSSPQARTSGSSSGAVSVQAHLTENKLCNGHSTTSWAVSIIDEGTGVPPDLRESIFRPYFTTKRDGNGIGLAVALQVVKAHGGQITVESPWPTPQNGSVPNPEQSARPKGARFTIHLPVSGPVLANDPSEVVASNGRSGASGGQDPRH